MKKLSFVTLFTFCLLGISIQSTNAQVLRQAGSGNDRLQYVSGSIEGAVYIKKSNIPQGTSINQIAGFVKQGLRAFEFIPQGSGFYQAQSIEINKSKALGNPATVSVKLSGDTYAIEYVIPKLPLMKPLRVEIVGNLPVPGYLFGTNPLLKNFPVAYLTKCDNTFECYNFEGVFTEQPK